jgi:uncharacterized protein YqgC (DUF456 family)
MADPWLVAVVLLSLGVLGSVVPLVPGAVFSLAGVGFYRWTTGAPDGVVLALLVALAVLALAVDYLGGAVAARAGGASLRTSAAAAGAALLLAPVLGPLGVVVGVLVTVFVLEVRTHGDLDAGARTAVLTLAGALAAALLQVLLTGAVLVGFLLFA